MHNVILNKMNRWFPQNCQKSVYFCVHLWVLFFPIETSCFFLVVIGALFSIQIISDEESEQSCENNVLYTQNMMKIVHFQAVFRAKFDFRHINDQWQNARALFMDFQKFWLNKKIDSRIIFFFNFRSKLCLDPVSLNRTRLKAPENRRRRFPAVFCTRKSCKTKYSFFGQITPTTTTRCVVQKSEEISLQLSDLLRRCFYLVDAAQLAIVIDTNIYLLCKIA